MAESDDKDQKTEEPTARKLEKAIEQGDVAKSQEVVSFFMLGAGTLAVAFLYGGAAKDLAGKLKGMLGNMHQISIDKAGLMQFGWFATLAIFSA
ncbi:MAG: EscU/YscU/HrcU family type III secretion system export apparatus switch protein, partial [Beijerinckiaceae bacterium]